MQKIQKGDEVVVITGKDKRKTGKVLRVMPKEDRALVEGLRLVKKHVRPNPQANQEGGIVAKESPIHLSNLAIFNPATKKADKVAVKVIDGKKVRVFKSTNEPIEVAH